MTKATALPDPDKLNELSLLSEVIHVLAINTPIYSFRLIDDDTIEVTTPYHTMTYRRPTERPGQTHRRPRRPSRVHSAASHT